MNAPASARRDAGDFAVPTDLPKVGPDVAPRPALDAWLDAHAGARVRAIAAPAGAGKTTAVARWARARAAQVAWIAVPPGATRAELCALLICALAARESGSLDAALRSTQRTQIVIDGVDAADFDGRAFLGRLTQEAPAGSSFVYLMRSVSALEFPGEIEVAMQRGNLLVFGSDEIERMCAAHRLMTAPAERARLLAHTGGWAMAVAGAIRYAAAMGGRLDSALARWTVTSRPLLEHLVDDALACAEPALAEAFHDLWRDEAAESAFALPLLADGGLFVEVIAGVHRINPVIASLRPAHGRPVRIAPAVLHLFGRFRLTIDGHDVVFARRRDRQIVQFLALRPDGAATRAELIATFWPDAAPQVAAHAVRTACSTIRRAIAEAAGRKHVPAYFQVDGNVVRLCFEHVASSVHRFAKHCELARAAEDEGRLDAAFAHWSAALGIHAAPLLSGEAPAPWMERAQAELAEQAFHAAGRVQALRYVEEVQPVTA